MESSSFQHRRLRSSSSSSTSSFSSASSCHSSNSESSMLTAYSPPLQPTTNSNNNSQQTMSENMCAPQSKLHHHHHNHHHHNHHVKRPLTRSRRASNDTLRNNSNRFNNKTLRRSTGLLNLDEATTSNNGNTTPPPRVPSPLELNNGNGLPLKRRLPSTSSTESTPQKFAFPKPPLPSKTRASNPVQQVLQRVVASTSTATDSPSFNNMIPNANQAAAKMRKMSSMDNMFAHVHHQEDNNNSNNSNPFATSPSPSPSPTFKSNNKRHSFQPYGISKPRLKLNSALNSEMNNDFSTPDNYKSVKPLQTAFMSTGLLSKRNRMKLDTRNGPPDTPCKLQWSSHHDQMQQHHYDHQATAHHMFPSSAKKVGGLRDNRLRFTIDFGNRDNHHHGGMMHDDDFYYDEPATPTKDQNGNDFTTSTTAAASFLQRTNQFKSNNETMVLMKDEDNFVIPPPASSSRRPSTNPEEPPRTPAKPKSLEDIPVALSATNSSEMLDPCLAQRFDNVALIGKGEFSMVYSAAQRVAGLAEPNRYAIKRTKVPFLGPKARQRRLEEVEILKQLNLKEDVGREHILTLFDAWDDNGHLYIQTDYCENGSLDAFIQEQGNISRLDEWRVWKILVELSIGINYIHQEGFLHLDLKPANVFITFEGTLKIGDFGMATRYPANHGIEREGDREYIAPEVLSSHHYDKPADIFSLGLMMLEIAANIVLPDNGVPWQKLRSGDLTEAGKLSSGDLRTHHHHHPNSNVPVWAPKFMVDDTAALDKMVQWMLNPDPMKRPTAQDLLMNDEVVFVEQHRKAGAVIYEGDYGPEPDVTDERQDEEMQL